jgi:hypothetical protein
LVFWFQDCLPLLRIASFFRNSNMRFQPSL